MKKMRVKFLTQARLKQKQEEKSRHEAKRDHYLYKQEQIMTNIHYCERAFIN